MGAIMDGLNSLVPKASAGGTGGVSNNNPNWHGPSHQAMYGGQQGGGMGRPQGPPQQQQQGQGMFGQMGSAGPFGSDRGTQNTMDQFGQRMNKEGFGAFNPMNMFGGGGQQGGGGGGFNPMGMLGGLFGGGGGQGGQMQQQGGQQGGGFNPFSFLGGL